MLRASSIRKIGTPVRITGMWRWPTREFASSRKVRGGDERQLAAISLWLSWRFTPGVDRSDPADRRASPDADLYVRAAAVGTLNLVPVGFGILFVASRFDFAIHSPFAYREMPPRLPEPAERERDRRRVGDRSWLAVAATALASVFYPTDFRGVAELGPIAGWECWIAFSLHDHLPPAAVTSFDHPGRAPSGLPLGGTARRCRPAATGSRCCAFRHSGWARRGPARIGFDADRCIPKTRHRGDADAVRISEIPLTTRSHRHLARTHPEAAAPG